MNDVLLLLVSLSISGGLLTGLTACLNRLLRGRMPKRFLYYLWLLVLLRFVCPFGSEQSLMNQLVSQPTVTLEEDVFVLVPEPAQSRQGSEAAVRPEEQRGTMHMAAAAAFALPLIWGIGAAVVLGRCLLGYHYLRKRLADGELALEQWEQELFGTMTGEKRSAPALLRSAGTSTPMLVGVFHPKIYLPPVPMSETDLRYALRHELVHWRRHDLLYKWCLTLVVSAHWFNPVAWYLVRAVERDCELSCDEAVVQTLSQKERVDYGAMLLETAAAQSQLSGALSAPLWSQKNNLKERLCGIMKPTLNSKQAKILLAAAVVLVTVTSVALGAYAGHVEGEPETASSEPVKNLEGNLVTALAADEGLVWPFEVDGEIQLSALYGGRIHPVTGQTNNHTGIDIVLPQGTPVLAAASGVVATAEYGSENGNYVVINHGDMNTIYCHMEKWTVEEGETVVAGQQIGTVGKTGAATGYHLHFEVAVNGSRVDPLQYLPQAAVYAVSGDSSASVEY